jgi:hypothetical protein
LSFQYHDDHDASFLTRAWVAAVIREAVRCTDAAMTMF